MWGFHITQILYPSEKHKFTFYAQLKGMDWGNQECTTIKQTGKANEMNRILFDYEDDYNNIKD